MAEIKRFGEKVRAERERLGLSQEELGNYCGITRRAVVSYETSGAIPRDKTLRKLSETLGVTMKYLTDDNENDPEAGIDAEPYIKEARDRIGTKAAKEMEETLSKSEALFAGGTLSEDQKDIFFEALSRAYFVNKQHARAKFGRKDIGESNE